jgi:hypothetical protein
VEAPVSSDADAVRRSVNPVIQAVASGDAGGLAHALPSLSKTQRAFFEDLFGRAEHIRPGASFGTAAITGDDARMSVTFNLRYDNRNSKQPERATLRYVGVFERKNGLWQLKELQSAR